MAASSWVVVVHVLVAFWFVTGVFGRDLVMARARRAERMEEVSLLMEVAGRFESWMVIPGSAAVLVVGIVAALARDIPFWGHGSWWLTTSIALFATTAALVPLVFLPHGRVFTAAFEDARTGGAVTPALRAALDDRAVSAARTYEKIAIVVVVALMVGKPF